MKAEPNTVSRMRALSSRFPCLLFFFCNNTATTEIYTLSLHDALPILSVRHGQNVSLDWDVDRSRSLLLHNLRSEEHTSELQSRQYLVCRLLLEKKKNIVATIWMNRTTSFTLN